ncbi:MAG: PA0069 family radical SAM protein [Marinibacterium sp.]|nr:PA0069 family radical SAM protein [Marinibacterium sp.]
MTDPLPIPPERRRARGALSNEAGRYDLERVHVDDGWDLPDDVPPLATETRIERPRSVISYNRSPDLDFDRAINPYRGCEHGCVYCFARPSHAWLGMSAGLDFETRLIARPDAPDVLARELAARRYRVAPIAIGTNTDPYQPIERDHGIMRACLEVLSQFNHPVAIVTKGAMIERDIDILAPMAARGLCRVGVSVTTLDADLCRRMEPRAAAPMRRLAVIRRLSDAGIPVRVMAAPMIPALSDHELEAILAAGAEMGACHASTIPLRLPREVSGLFQDWLAEHVPYRADRVMARVREMHGGRDYDPQWGRRMRGEGAYADLLQQRFRRACKALGLAHDAPALRCDLFAVPPRPGDQLSLF